MMDEAKKRVIDEYRQLNERCLKLWRFIRESRMRTLSKEQQNLLIMQLTTMIEYKDILRRRLKIWDLK